LVRASFAVSTAAKHSSRALIPTLIPVTCRRPRDVVGSCPDPEGLAETRWACRGRPLGPRREARWLPRPGPGRCGRRGWSSRPTGWRHGPRPPEWRRGWGEAVLVGVGVDVAGGRCLMKPSP